MLKSKTLALAMPLMASALLIFCQCTSRMRPQPFDADTVVVSLDRAPYAGMWTTQSDVVRDTLESDSIDPSGFVIGSDALPMGSKTLKLTADGKAVSQGVANISYYAWDVYEDDILLLRAKRTINGQQVDIVDTADVTGSSMRLRRTKTQWNRTKR